MTLRHPFWWQAGLDGELLEGKFQKEGGALRGDGKTQSVLRGLNLVKSAPDGSELERCLPQSRECYWDKIERAIRESPATEPTDAGRRAGSRS